jgi:hypothetical protein
LGILQDFDSSKHRLHTKGSVPAASAVDDLIRQAPQFSQPAHSSSVKQVTPVLQQSHSNAQRGSLASAPDFSFVVKTLMDRLVLANEKLVKLSIDERLDAEKWMDHVCKIVTSLKLINEK